MVTLILVLALQSETSVNAMPIGEKPAPSKITEREFHRVMDGDAWRKLWARHAGRDVEAPAVDFEKFMVVAGLLGPKGGVRRLQVQAGFTDEQMTVRFGPHVICAGRPEGEEVGFFFARVPRYVKKLVVQQCEGADGGKLVSPKTEQEFPALRK